MTQNPKINYIKASTYYMLGTLFNKGISLLTIPIFTRLLSTVDYGIVNTYNAWSGIVGMVVSCALYMGIRLAFLDYSDKIDDFMSVIITFTALFSAVIVAIYCIGAQFVQPALGVPLGVLCIVHGTASMLIEDYSMYLQMKFRYRTRTALLLLPNLLSVCVAVILIRYIMKQNLYLGKILPNASICIGIAFLIMFYVYRKSHVLFNKEYLAYAFRISLPLVLHGIALNILSQSDRIMITYFAGASQSGIYSLIYNYGMAATVITTGFNGIWDPWLLKNMKEEKYQSINQLAEKYIKLVSWAMVAIIIVAPEIVKMLAPEPYWDGIQMIPAIVLANYIIYMYTFYVSIEHYYKKTQRIALNTIFAALLNLVLNYIFIPKYGYIAAAYTTVASYVFCLLLHIVYAKKMMPALFPIKQFLFPAIQVTIGVVAFYLFLDSMWIRWIMLTIYSAIIIWLNRKVILSYCCNLQKTSMHRG